MSTYDTMASLRKGIKKANPQMTEEQVQAEAERYFTEELPPMYSEREIFEMLEDNELRRPGIPHRPMPRYTGEERRQRRECSRRLRQAIYPVMQDHAEITNEYTYYQDEGRPDPRTNFVLSEEERQRLEADRRIFSRGSQWLFYPTVRPEQFFRENPEATQDDLEAAQQRNTLRNEEIAFLFDTNTNHWNAYFAEAVPQRRASDPELANMSDAEIRAELEAELARRRTDMLMVIIQETLDETKNVYEMADGSLPPEVQGENLAKIARANCLLMDIDNDYRQRTDLSLTEQERQQMQDWMKLQGAYNEAFKRITIRANPLYEILDPELLTEQYDLGKLKERYDDDLYADERGTEFRAERERKCPEVKRYTQLGGGDAADGLRNLLGDLDSSVAASRDLEIDKVFQTTVEQYGFTLGGEDGAECFCDEFDANGRRRLNDEAGVNELKSGRPLLFRQGERVAVLTLKNPMSAAMTWSKPEALFNYGLAAENTAMLKQIADSDKWYQTRSGNFKHMREAFEALAAEGKTLGDTEKERTALVKQYKDVLKLCDTYLDAKEREGVGEGHNPLERGHIAAARALRAHLTTKLDEIELVDKARQDLRKYSNMTAEQVRADIAREQKYPMNEIRRQNISRWLEATGRSYRNEIFPAAVGAAINEGSAGLMRYLTIDPKSTMSVRHNLINTNVSQMNAVDFVGGMIAAEMIKAEREQRAAQQLEGAGPIERSFEDAETARERIKDLGEDAVEEVMGKMAGSLLGEELARFISTVDAEQLAREMPAALQLKADIEQDAHEAAEQADREAREAADKPLREEQDKLSKVGLGVYTFTQKDIVPLMDKLRGALAGGQTTYSLRDSVDLLSSYVILGMIQMEELGGSSKLTRVMRDDEAAKTLQVNLQMTKGFGDMLKEITAEDGNAASIEKISKVLAEKKPQELARQILTDTKFKQSIESHMKEHGIELGKGFKLGAKNEQKHEQQPVQQVPNK